MDTINSRRRSEVMASIRSTGNLSTEKRFRAFLIKSRLRGWKVHPKHVPGNPDFVFRKEKLAIFVDGCFWHGCPKCYRKPKSSVAYWVDKVKRNRARDHKVAGTLRRGGWSVMRIWEHSLSNRAAVLERVKNTLRRRGRKKIL